MGRPIPATPPHWFDSVLILGSCPSNAPNGRWGASWSAHLQIKPKAKHQDLGFEESQHMAGPENCPVPPPEALQISQQPIRKGKYGSRSALGWPGGHPLPSPGSQLGVGVPLGPGWCLRMGRPIPATPPPWFDSVLILGSCPSNAPN